MGYSIINLNYSNDSDGEFEKENLAFLTYEQKARDLVANLECDSLKPETYTLYCEQMIQYCESQMRLDSYCDLEKRKVSLVCLITRIEEIKRKLQSGDSLKDALKPYLLYEVGFTRKYQDTALFNESEISIQKKACEQVIVGMSKRKWTTSNWSVFEHLSELNWLIKWADPCSEKYLDVLTDLLLSGMSITRLDQFKSLDSKLDIALLQQILTNEKLVQKFSAQGTLANLFELLLVRKLDVVNFLQLNTLCIDWLAASDPANFIHFIKKLDNKIDETLLSRILSNEKLILIFHAKEKFYDFLNLFINRKTNICDYLLNNINSIDLLAKNIPGLIFRLAKCFSANNFFKTALQRGFNFQHCLTLLMENFVYYRSELTFVLYEALSRGINKIAKDLAEFSNSHKVEKNKVKTTSTPLTMFLASLQQTVTTHQQLTSYDQSVIAFSFDDLLKYLQEKFQQTTKQNEPNSTPKETLHFIKHPKAFMQSLVELQLISKENHKEFTMTFCTLFKIPHDEVLETEERNIAEAPDLLKMFQAMQKQIQELQAENLEFKRRFEQLESQQSKSNYQAP